MKLISYVITISTILALTDYFKAVEDMYPQLQKDRDYTEERLPAKILKIRKKDGIQILSIAVHGGRIEPETDKIAKKLYEKVKPYRQKSVLYNFISKIDSIQSGKIKTNRCKTTQCCKTIKGSSGNVTDNKAFSKSKCESFNKVPEDECEKVCYLNAAHITSTEFMTGKLKGVLPCRYPISFHGYSDRNDVENLPVDIVLGGFSSQKHKLAQEFYKISKKYRVAVCISSSECRVYDPSKSFDNRIEIKASSLSGDSKNNFVNKGILGCGLQVELSYTFRIKGPTLEKYWDKLINAIVNTIPYEGKDIC
ncbi:hypothetical protein CONCODRAFT_170587 [Conidiobolus coronatus NRRL 28638]|uniref:Uncharacterized protein n=1 Tax=Conidiobolus coronatus (strain ATCC 28846 / CBS 209.66 / NRRL 28638) TaxID=796925 RepID=A0A137P6K8_CONC2|nr:hypothetical protein CONCODRAFT_170587 [Conidiobolus coronatus NRRL 28638]|eukprot:KXN70638.1 hypothetical protein CONCODRAFT_170587 [Conidiobolus coronatus NRRL 28638]